MVKPRSRREVTRADYQMIAHMAPRRLLHPDCELRSGSPTVTKLALNRVPPGSAERMLTILLCRCIRSVISTMGDGRPDGFHNTKRPRALQETVDRRQGAGGCEGEDKPGAPIFQRIEYQHGRDGCQTKQRETIHLIQSHGISTLL